MYKNFDKQNICLFTESNDLNDIGFPQDLNVNPRYITSNSVIYKDTFGDNFLSHIKLTNNFIGEIFNEVLDKHQELCKYEFQTVYAPTYETVVKWFREEKKLLILVDYFEKFYNNDNYGCKIYDLKYNYNITTLYRFSCYDDAIQAGVGFCIKVCKKDNR